LIGNSEDRERDLYIANEILKQLGGLLTLKRIVRARNLKTVPGGVMFQFCGSEKFTHVRITLEGDQYNLHFYLIRRSKGGTTSVLNQITKRMISAGDLRQVFEDATKLVLGESA
jgi:hypothetical protein